MLSLAKDSEFFKINILSLTFITICSVGNKTDYTTDKLAIITVTA